MANKLNFPRKACQCCLIPLKPDSAAIYCNLCQEWLLVGLAVELARAAWRGVDHVAG